MSSPYGFFCRFIIPYVKMDYRMNTSLIWSIVSPLFLGLFILMVTVISQRKKEEIGIDHKTMWDFGLILTIVGYVSGVYVYLAGPGAVIAALGLMGKKTWPQTVKYRKATLGYLVSSFLILLAVVIYGSFTFGRVR